MSEFLLLFAEAGLALHRGKLLERDRVRVKNPKLGRPDILHVSLLNFLQTPAVEMRLIEGVIHNFDGKIIRFRHDRRVPKRYERFRGLMEQLLKASRVPPSGEPIVWISKETLRDVLRGRYVIGLTSRGRLKSLEELIREAPRGSAFVVGMFPHGYFSDELDELFDERIAISRYSLKAWTVVARLVYVIERHYGIL